VTAAALGRPELVNAFLDHDGSLQPGVPLAKVQWPPLPADPKVHVALGLVWACKFGRTEVVKVMLARQVDPASADVDGMTGLHWAAANGHMAVMDLLLAHHAPLELKNRWGGTVLDSTVFFALNGPVPGVDYQAVTACLLAAGAEGSAVEVPTGNAAIDALLRHYRR
jgi:ankyrin repeat protein